MVITTKRYKNIQKVVDKKRNVSYYNQHKATKTNAKTTKCCYTKKEKVQEYGKKQN